ncbi:MAG: hypothetical protein IPP77_11525 [Bacteroidetes bacterium]|nr:hypothetical protein [Bacteroidota bacterium]
MKTIENLFLNFFDDKNITSYRLQYFADETLAKLINVNTGGQYDAVIADLTAKIAAMSNFQVQILIDISQQMGKTYTVNEIFEAFMNEVRLQFGVIQEKYRNDEKTFLLFYPQGMKEYNRSRNKTKIHSLMVAFADAILNHAADFPPATVTLFTNFPTAFQTAQNAQSSKMGMVSSNRASLHKTREALNESLLVAVLTAGAVEKGNIIKLKALFDFSLLLPRHHSAAKEKYHGLIHPNKTEVAVHDTFPEGTRIRFSNFSNIELKIGGHASADGTGIVWQTVKANKTKTFRIEQLMTSPSDTYILIFNPDLNDACAWQMLRWVE